MFSVAIRTLVVDPETGDATLGIGAGIVADSRADDEYDECLLEGAFVDAQPLAGRRRSSACRRPHSATSS